MQIVKVGGEAKSPDGAFDVLLDMGSGIGNNAIFKDRETTFRGNCEVGSE